MRCSTPLKHGRKNAEAADKGLALVRAEEVKAVNAFHEAQAADVRVSARLQAAQESLEQLQAQQRESGERLQVRRDAFLLAAKHCFATDTDLKAVLAEPQSFTRPRHAASVMRLRMPLLKKRKKS